MGESKVFGMGQKLNIQCKHAKDVFASQQIYSKHWWYEADLVWKEAPVDCFLLYMHLNSVQICFWLLFDSRRLFRMNSNEMLRICSAYGRTPPAIHMHAMLSARWQFHTHSNAQSQPTRTHISTGTLTQGDLVNMCILITTGVCSQQMFPKGRFRTEKSLQQNNTYGFYFAIKRVQVVFFWFLLQRCSQKCWASFCWCWQTELVLPNLRYKCTKLVYDTCWSMLT